MASLVKLPNRKIAKVGANFFKYSFHAQKICSKTFKILLTWQNFPDLVPLPCTPMVSYSLVTFCLSDDVIDDEVVVNLKGSGKGKQQKKWEQQFKGAHSMQNDNTRLFNLKHWRLLVWRFFGTDNQ